MYFKTEQKCRKITKYMSRYIPIHQSIVIASFFNSIHCICIGNLDTSTWDLAFNIVVPFDTQNLFGWYLKWFIQLSMSVSYALSVTSITSYFICCCLYIHAICKHLNLLNNLIQENNESIHGNLIKAINAQAKVFEYVSNQSNF